MKKDQVKIGQVYAAKVTNKVVPVRIESEHAGGGGWNAVNLRTNRPVRIKSAQRLRSRITVPGAEDNDEATPAPRSKKRLGPAERKASAAHIRAQAKADQENARVRDEREASADGMTASERAMTDSADDAATAKNPTGSAKRSKKRARRDTAQPPEGVAKRGKPKRTSLLDAAAAVLSDTGEALGTGELVERAVARGLWTPGAGKTPAATLYSAIIREIRGKGDASRFVKAEPGRFTAKKGA